MTLTQQDKFINAVIPFQKESLRYALTKMNVQNTFQGMTKWIVFSNRGNAKWRDIKYSMCPYSGILQFDDYGIEKVNEEFVDFKCLKQSEFFPAGLPDDTVVRE